MKVDPRASLIVAAIISTLSLIISDVGSMVVLFILAVVVAVLMGGDLMRVFSRLRPMLTLFVTLLIVQSVFAPSGSVLIAAGQFPIITTGGLTRGSVVIIRMLVIITSGVMLLRGDAMKFVRALVKIRIPYEIAFMVLVAVRFLPVVTSEFRDALVAIQLRGVSLRRIPLRDKLRVYVGILMPVAASSLLRAKRLALIMELRGFRSHSDRTFVDDVTMRGIDWAITVTAVVLGTSYLFWRWIF